MNYSMHSENIRVKESARQKDEPLIDQSVTELAVASVKLTFK